MKTVVILCAPRSGSTMLARILHSLGVYMGRGLVRKHYLNNGGTFEDKDFEVLIRKILITSGSRLNWLQPLEYNRILSQGKKFSRRIKKLIGKRSAYYRIWGWKLPLTGRVIPLLHPYLPDPHYIILERNPESVARSFSEKIDSRNNVFPHIKAVLTNPAFWNVHFLYRKVSDILSGRCDYKDQTAVKQKIRAYYNVLQRFAADKKSITMSYEDMLAAPGAAVNRIIAFLSIDQHKVDKQSLLGIIDADKKHF